MIKQNQLNLQLWLLLEVIPDFYVHIQIVQIIH